MFNDGLNKQVTLMKAVAPHPIIKVRLLFERIFMLICGGTMQDAV